MPAPTPNKLLGHVDRVIQEAIAIASDASLPVDHVEHALRAKASTIGLHIDFAMDLSARRGPRYNRRLARRIQKRRQRIEDEPSFKRFAHLRPDFLSALQLPSDIEPPSTQLSIA